MDLARAPAQATAICVSAAVMATTALLQGAQLDPTQPTLEHFSGFWLASKRCNMLHRGKHLRQNVLHIPFLGEHANHDTRSRRIGSVTPCPTRSPLRFAYVEV